MTKYLLIVAGLLVTNSVWSWGECYGVQTLSGACPQERQRTQEFQLQELERQQKEAEYQRSRPVQVIGPEGIHTYYPSSDGRTWTNYGGIDTRR